MVITLQRSSVNNGQRCMSSVNSFNCLTNIYSVPSVDLYPHTPILCCVEPICAQSSMHWLGFINNYCDS